MKDILELIGVIVISILVFLFLADTKITFSPFSFKCLHLMKASGWIIVVIGISLIVADASRDRYEKGVKDGSAYTIKEIDRVFQEAVKKKDSVVSIKVDLDTQEDIEEEGDQQLDK
jgi:hypothetical protein